MPRRESQKASEQLPRIMPLAVMRAISVLGSNAYGTKIHVLLESYSGTSIPVAQIYLAAGRLRARGFIKNLPSQRSGAHPRKPYALSAAGKRALETSLRLLGVQDY